MEDINFIDQHNENIDIDDGDELDNNNNTLEIDNNNSWELLLNELGLYVMNYPLKLIKNGILELHTFKTSTVNSKYYKNIKFKDDQISKKIESILFGEHLYPPYSHMQLYHIINRSYRRYRYNKRMNIIDSNKDKKDIIGFNYDNPRWNTLDIEKISLL